MKYINRIANLIVWSIFITQPVLGQGTDYTTRTFTTQSCKLFAHDAYRAASIFKEEVLLRDILESMNAMSIAESKKHRAFQAIQLVWKNQLDNPVLAFSLAMGLCLRPKEKMAPIDEPWAISLRTSKEFY